MKRLFNNFIVGSVAKLLKVQLTLTFIPIESIGIPLVKFLIILYLTIQLFIITPEITLKIPLQIQQAVIHACLVVKYCQVTVLYPSM